MMLHACLNQTAYEDPRWNATRKPNCISALARHSAFLRFLQHVTGGVLTQTYTSVHSYIKITGAILKMNNQLVKNVN